MSCPSNLEAVEHVSIGQSPVDNVKEKSDVRLGENGGTIDIVFEIQSSTKSRPWDYLRSTPQLFTK
jgi:hypothetical protein